MSCESLEPSQTIENNFSQITFDCKDKIVDHSDVLVMKSLDKNIPQTCSEGILTQEVSCCFSYVTCPNEDADDPRVNDVNNICEYSNCQDNVVSLQDHQPALNNCNDLLESMSDEEEISSTESDFQCSFENTVNLYSEADDSIEEIYKNNLFIDDQSDNIESIEDYQSENIDSIEDCHVEFDADFYPRKSENFDEDFEKEVLVSDDTNSVYSDNGCCESVSDNIETEVKSEVTVYRVSVEMQYLSHKWILV